MFLLYVDESGDSGLTNSPSNYFVLSGIVVHELRWNHYLDRIVDFRKRMRDTHGLLLREEIHSAALINSPGALARIPRNNRVSIIRHFANELASLNDISVINVVVDKRGKAKDYDVLERAWTALIQRFSNTMSHRNFSGPANPDETGMVIPDQSEVKKITRLLRRMRKYNPIPNQTQHGAGYRNLLVSNLVEDPYFKNSAHSYYIQAADLAAFLMYQKLQPSAYAKKKSIQNYFKRLDPILCKVASSSDPNGIVWL